MQKKSIKALQDLVPGDLIDHLDWNAILEVARAEVKSEQGVSSPTGTATTSVKRPEVRSIEFFSTEALAKNQIFGVDSEKALRANSPRCQLSTSGIHPMYYTNELTIAENSWGWGKPINMLEPVLIESHNDLVVGEQCGVRPGTTKLDNSYVGFTALAEDSDKMWWVIKSHDSAFIGKVTTRLSPFRPGTRTLGTGQVEIYRRDESTSLNLVTTGNTWDVYCECELGVEVGDWVKVLPVNGVGLVAHPYAIASSDSSGSAVGGSGSCANSVIAVKSVIRNDSDQLVVTRVSISFSKAQNCLIETSLDSNTIDLCTVSGSGSG